MKKLLSLSVATLTLVAVAATAQAQVISVQFDNSTIASKGYTAGVVPETIWNSDTNSTSYTSPGTSSLSNLQDSTGTNTTVSESTVNDGTYPPYHSMAFTNPGDAALFANGYLAGYPTAATDPFSLTLTGLNTADTYSLILYAEGTGDSNELLSSTLGTSTYYFDTATSTTSSYIQATSTTFTPAVTGNSPAPAFAPVANYVEFTGLTGATLTATINSESNDFNVNGFQLINNGLAAPEPSTYALLGLGLAGLVFLVRRRSIKA